MPMSVIKRNVAFRKYDMNAQYDRKYRFSGFDFGLSMRLSRNTTETAFDAGS